MGSIFHAAPTGQLDKYLVQFKAGLLTLVDGKLVADKRKGEMALHRSDDGLVHFSWRDLASQTAEHDLIIFPQDAELKRLDACKDAYAMVLEFSTSSRKLFFWSQQLRGKGADGWAAEDELLASFNDTMNSRTPLANNTVSGGDAMGGTTPVNAAGSLGTTGAPNAGGAGEPAGTAPAAAGPTTTGGQPSTSGGSALGITQDRLQSILQGVLESQGQSRADGGRGCRRQRGPCASHASRLPRAGQLLPAMFAHEAMLEAVRRHRADLDEALRPHLPTPPFSDRTDSVEETLRCPQLRQAVEQLAGALLSPNAEQIYAELDIRPDTPGVRGFLEALQRDADARRQRSVGGEVRAGERHRSQPPRTSPTAPFPGPRRARPRGNPRRVAKAEMPWTQRSAPSRASGPDGSAAGGS